MKRLALPCLMLALTSFGIRLSIAADPQLPSAGTGIQADLPEDQSATIGVSSQPANARCLECHKDMTMIPPSGAHLAFSCATCHQPHDGKPQDNMELGLKACTAACHGRHDLGLSHPMGDDLRDETGITLTCVSVCHSIHLPSSDHLLRAEGSDVCGDCHADKF